MHRQKKSFLLALYLFLASCLAGCKSDDNDDIYEVINTTIPTLVNEINDNITETTEVITIEPTETEVYEITEETETYKIEETEVLEIEETYPKKEIVLTLDEIAFLTIGGKYGYGDTRRENITNLGFDYDIVSQRVSELLNGSSYSIPDRNTYYFNFGYVKEKVDVYDEFGNREGSLSSFQKFIISDKKVDGMTLVYFQDQTFYLKDTDIKRIGDSHLEIDISEQKVYFYIDGNLILEADVITGHPNKGTTHGTNIGITEVLRISYDVTFDGGKVSKIFILFNWDGEGFHDAGWRDIWEFNDKGRYITNGSNGCCNMKEEDVFIIEENTYLGMPVLIHK